MLLAIETSGRGGGLALATADRGVIAASDLAPGTSTAAGLIPAVARLLALHNLGAGDLRAVAVAAGPGSFTGLRVGVTTAKTLAYATGAALIGIDTLHVIAEQCPEDVKSVWTLLDAQRGELYAARWKRAADGWTTIRPSAIVTIDALSAGLSPEDWLSGPACAWVVDRMPNPVQMTASAAWSPQAATVARLALRRWAAGDVDDPWRLAPRYLRRAAAEEKGDAVQKSRLPTRESDVE